MMKRAILLGCISIAAIACASDPNKKVNEAQDEQLKTERRSEQAAAEDRKDVAADQAEQQRKSTVAGGTPGTEADQKRLKADAKMTEARQVALAKANERLQKCDAKTNELRAQVNKAGGKATTASRDSLQAVETQRNAAKTSIDQLANTDDASFKQAKDYADNQLDTLEAYVKKAGKEVDDFK